MKKILGLSAAAAVLALGGIALAGDGFGCSNMCPLAKKAGEHRSFGTEGSAARTAALSAQVAKSLAKV